MQNLISVLMGHRSVRKFTDAAISSSDVETILRCAQMSPTSSYLQAYTIIEVTDKEKREVLFKASGNQPWVKEAPLALLFCGDLHRSEKFLPIKDANVLHNSELFTVAVVDAALAAQKALIAAQALGLGGVVVGGIRTDIGSVASAFNLPSLVYPLFLLCIGFPEEVPPQRPRMPLSFVTGKDSYPEINDINAMQEYDKAVSEYFNNLTNGVDTFGWISRCNHALEMKPRYCVGEFLHEAGFNTKNSPSNE